MVVLEYELGIKKKVVVFILIIQSINSAPSLKSDTLPFKVIFVIDKNNLLYFCCRQKKAPHFYKKRWCEPVRESEKKAPDSAFETPSVFPFLSFSYR